LGIDEAVTDYSEFFDLQHMQAAVPVISAEEFRRREAKHMTEEFMNADFTVRAGQKVFQAFVKDTTDHPTLDWSPLAHVVYWPSIDAVNEAWKDRGGVPSSIVHHRKNMEFTP
jgi:hypothetical protein